MTKNKSLVIHSLTGILFLQMVELVDGSTVYWYSQQRAYCSAFKNWSAYVNAAVDIFFSKDKLSSSCAMGNEKKSKTGDSHQPLNPLIVQAIIGRYILDTVSGHCLFLNILSIVLPPRQSKTI